MEFKLVTTPNITKEYIFSQVSQEQIMEHYLGVPVKKGLFVCPSSIRQDTKPTCAFYKNSRGTLMFKDFAGISGDCISIVMEIFQVSYYKALRIVANDFNLIDIPKMEINPPKIAYTGAKLKETEFADIQVEIKDFTDKELDWWKKFGVTEKILKKYRVFSLQSVFLRGNYYTSSSTKAPIYGYYGGKNSNGYELWRIYMPHRATFRFLSNWRVSHIQGVRQLPRIGDSLIITKSLKDVMTLDSLNIPAISPVSETVVISDNSFQKFSRSFKEVLCFYDNDLPGVKGAQNYKRQFNIRCIFIKRKYAKDISDLWKKATYLQKLLIEQQLKQILEDKSITNTKHFHIFNG